MAYVNPVYHGGRNQPEQVTDDYLTCPICQEPGFIHPKILLCGHAFCLPCLERFIPPDARGTFPCPKCRRSTLIPPNGPVGFKDYLFANTQIDRLLRRHNQVRRRDDTFYNIATYEMRYDGQATLSMRVRP
ncbi:hypothetical protein NP493_294g00039 [Ridgeia piscesae]|uniref:RING-type domain-containing protein n=1 Tax=Ridgeia piscesae TaxID=27915 RepID=A0AAD9NWP0_RIDPI|nr:hypothetical protein NP493_294g00039 [Ridgeia piscesae]